VPESIDEGMFATEAGQSVTAHSISGSNSESALAVIKSAMSDTATAFGVPAYKLGLTADSAVQSGVALAIMNAPLMADRSRRIELNRSNMARIFAIECALASMENGAPVGKGVVETWIPNEPPTYDEQSTTAVIGEGDQDTETATTADGTPVDNVQSQVLNGAQVSSMVEIAQTVKSGILSREQGVAIIKLAVPMVGDDMAGQIAGDYDPTMAQEVQKTEAALEPKPSTKSRLFGARGAAK